MSIGFSEYRSRTRALIAVAAELFRRGQAAVQGHPRADQRHLVAGAGPDDLGPADRELLVRPVQHRVRAAGGAHVDDAVAVGHLPHQVRGGRRVARVQDRGAVHGPHHREVFQGHLRRAVGTDLDPGVGAAQADVRRGDGRHPDEVVGAGEERGEGGGEGDVPAHGQADGGRDELLLGDEHLEVALGIRLGELLGVGGVAHLAVEGDDIARGRRSRPAPRRRPAGWRPWRPARSGAGSPRRSAGPGRTRRRAAIR